MSEAVVTEFTSNIRPLTAAEYIGILAGSDVELRISDGSPEQTWRFWVENDTVVFRRLSWTQNKTCDASFLDSVLDGDGTTQLVAPGDVE